MRREIEYFINVRNTKGWKGLAVVLGQKRQLVLVWYGGTYYRIYPSHLMKLMKNIKVKSLPVSKSLYTPNCNLIDEVSKPMEHHFQRKKLLKKLMKMVKKPF